VATCFLKHRWRLFQKFLHDKISTRQVFLKDKQLLNFILCGIFLHFFFIAFLIIFRGINLPYVKFAKNDSQNCNLSVMIETWRSSLSLVMKLKLVWLALLVVWFLWFLLTDARNVWSFLRNWNAWFWQNNFCLLIFETMQCIFFHLNSFLFIL